MYVDSIRPLQPRQRLKVSPRKFKEKLQPLFLLLQRLYSTAAKADHFFQKLRMVQWIWMERNSALNLWLKETTRSKLNCHRRQFQTLFILL